MSIPATPMDDGPLPRFAVCDRRQDGRQRVLAEFRDVNIAKAYADALRRVGNPAEVLLLSELERE